MKKTILLLFMGLWSFTINAKENDGAINYIEPGAYQLIYTNQIVNVIFNPSSIPGSNEHFGMADLNEEDRKGIVQILKNQIDLFPSEFIRDYLNVRIFPTHIFDRKIFGYYYGDKIVIEVDKIISGISYTQSLTSSFILELGYIVEQRQHSNRETKKFKIYLEEFHENNRFLIQDNSNIYQSGFVSSQAAGRLDDKYSSTEEFVQLFQHLMCINNRDKLVQFMDLNPDSELTKKVNKFIEYLESTIHSLNRDYFFGNSHEIKEPSAQEMALNGAQLLASHELKSNELFDFTLIPGDEESQFELESNEQKPELKEDTYEYYFTTNAERRTKQIETLIYQDSSKDSKNDKKKPRRKKNGTGLLIAGTALYIALQLLK